MERWLMGLQKIGKALPYGVMGLLALTAVAMGVYAWKRPVLQSLEAKDPYRYELMIREAVRLQWFDAWNHYRTLKTITREELVRERYARWKHRWDTDPVFREDILRHKTETQKQLHELHEKQYAAWMDERERARRQQAAQIRKVHWELATPWQKTLILRDGCVRYLSQEIEDYRNRRHVRGTLKGAAVRAHPRIADASPGGLCREMVSLAHDEPSVHRALLNLQKGINHYYFLRLLEDAGVPDDEWFTVAGKLEGMTRDLNGY